MEENKQANQAMPGAESSTTGSNKAQSSQELIDELNRLGAKFADVVQAAWESDERKRLEKDVRAGVVTLVSGVERGLRKVGESEHAKDLLNKAEEVADSIGERIRTSPTSHELAGNLAKGLRVLAEQIDKLAEELQQKSAASASTAKSATAADDSQNIPITKV
ncbi:MAG: hypothetical protein KF832_00075 [Caldilineaceae bacterium]|nr:hypothetical protein [Caldilineaceae bacterium]